MFSIELLKPDIREIKQWQIIILKSRIIVTHISVSNWKELDDYETEFIIVELQDAQTFIYTNYILVFSLFVIGSWPNINVDG